MDSLGKVVTPWSSGFDGREYIVSLSVIEQPKAMSILITDKITAEEWSCQHDLKYVEDLTRKTGCYKPFDIFISMIKHAILKSTNSVKVELYSIQDLKILKKQKHCQGLIASSELEDPVLKNVKTYADYSQNEVSSSANKNKVKEETDKKKYLIVSYQAEFDNVHYPIPLIYSGAPDPIKMQNQIKQLRNEVVQLKNVTAQLENELATTTKAANSYENPPPPRCTDPQLHRKSASSSSTSRPQVSNMIPLKTLWRHDDNSQDDLTSLQNLISVIDKLQDQLRSQKELFECQIAQVKSENKYLLIQIKNFEKNESIFLLRISQLERELENFNNISKNKNNGDDEDDHGSNHNKNNAQWKKSDHNHHQHLQMSLNNNREGSNSNCNLRRRSRSRTSSIYSSEQQRACRASTNGNNGGPTIFRQQSKSPDPNYRRSGETGTTIGNCDGRKSRKTNFFDPTAYIRQKNLKQEEIRKLRMSQIEKSIQERKSRNMSSRERVRSLSRPNSYRHSSVESRQSQSGYERNPSRDSGKGFRRAPPISPRSNHHQSRSPFRRGVIANTCEVETKWSRPDINIGRENDKKHFSNALKTNNYEPGRHTKSRLERRRARSQSYDDALSDGQSSVLNNLHSGSRPPKPSKQTKVDSRKLSPNANAIKPPIDDAKNITYLHNADADVLNSEDKNIRRLVMNLNSNHDYDHRELQQWLLETKAKFTESRETIEVSIEGIKNRNQNGGRQIGLASDASSTLNSKNLHEVLRNNPLDIEPKNYIFDEEVKKAFIPPPLRTFSSSPQRELSQIPHSSSGGRTNQLRLRRPMTTAELLEHDLIPPPPPGNSSGSSIPAILRKISETEEWPGSTM